MNLRKLLLAALACTTIAFPARAANDAPKHSSGKYAEMCVTDDTAKDVKLLRCDPGSGATEVTEVGMTTVASGAVTVTTAGTSIQGSNVAVKECWFAAPTGNTGQCFIGAATGDNRQLGLVLTKNLLPAGPVHISNLNKLWFDCATSADKVAYFCTK